MPLFAQNLSTPLVTYDVSQIFDFIFVNWRCVYIFKTFAETPLKLFTLYTTKISKPSIKKQSIPPIYCEF